MATKKVKVYLPKTDVPPPSNGNILSTQSEGITITAPAGPSSSSVPASLICPPLTQQIAFHSLELPRDITPGTTKSKVSEKIKRKATDTGKEIVAFEPTISKKIRTSELSEVSFEHLTGVLYTPKIPGCENLIVLCFILQSLAS